MPCLFWAGGEIDGGELTEACSDYEGVYVEVVCIGAGLVLMTDGIVCEFRLELLVRIWNGGCRCVTHDDFRYVDIYCQR